MITDINKILVEWAYRTSDGQPDVKSKAKLLTLESVLIVEIGTFDIRDGRSVPYCTFAYTRYPKGYMFVNLAGSALKVDSNTLYWTIEGVAPLKEGKIGFNQFGGGSGQSGCLGIGHPYKA